MLPWGQPQRRERFARRQAAQSTEPTEVTFNLAEKTICLPPVVGGLAKAFSSDMMDEESLRFLAASILESRIGNDDLVVEIGAYVGLTTAFLSRVLDELGIDAAVLSIDLFERVLPDRFNPRGSYKRYLRNIKGHRADKRCIPLVASSHDAHRVVPDHIGLLLVDGDHTYESTKADLEHYSPKVRNGGIIFVDDYSYETYPGVARAIDEFFGAASYRLLHKALFVVGLKPVEE